MPIDFITEMGAYLAAGVEMEFNQVQWDDGTITCVTRTKNPCAITRVNGRLVVVEHVGDKSQRFTL